MRRPLIIEPAPRFGGGATAPAPAYPTPDWHIESEDAVFVANALTTWPSVIGPTFSPTASYAPSDLGPSLNGIPSVLFPTASAQAYYTGTIKSGTHTEWVMENVLWPDNYIGAGNREYPVEIANTAGADKIAAAHSSNNGGSYLLYGHSRGGSWCHGTGAPVNYPEVFTVRQNSDYSVSFFRNGVLLETVASTEPITWPLAWTNPYIGSSYGSPPSEFFKGGFFSHRSWVGQTLTDAQVIAAQEERMERFAIATPAWLPSDEASMRLWVDQSNKLAASAAVFTGAGLAQWGNRYGSNHVTQGTVGNQPRDGARINGLPTVDFDGTDDFMGAAAVTNFMSASAYHVFAIVNVDACNTNSANGYSNDGIISDVDGFWWLSVRNNAGTITVYGGHWDGAEKSAIASGLALGTPALIEWWYDGTTVRCRVNDGTVAIVAAGNYNDGTPSLTRIGGKGTSLQLDGQIGELVVCNAALAGGTETPAQASARAYLGDKWGVSV